MKKNLSNFEKIIGINFNNKDLLRQAFLHRSYLNEHPLEKLGNNERLEFLGDAVLEIVITEYLYTTFPDKTEGELTAYRSALVNTQSISQAAQDFKMNDFILLSKGESKDTGKARLHILANTYEAVIGAIYLDGGYDLAKEFIKNSLFDSLKKILDERLWQDAKSNFQEKAQEKKNITPSYDLIEEIGPAHDKKFTIGVYLDEKKIAEGKGKSKQEAEQDAADNALHILKWK